MLNWNAYLRKHLSPIIVIDFNVHFDDELKSEPLRDLPESFNMLQHVISHDTDNLVPYVVVYPH